MSRSRRLLAWGSLAALVLLAGCTAPVRTNSAPPRPRAASTDSAVPSTDPASTRPGGDSDLYAMNPDGSAVTRLTHATSEDQEPAFCTGACR
jgi:hypothetical protein